MKIIDFKRTVAHIGDIFVYIAFYACVVVLMCALAYKLTRWWLG